MGIANRARKIALGNKRHNLTGTKEAFLQLCRQYAAIAKMLGALPKHPAVLPILTQHFEMGEQLKYLGAGLDALGGIPVLEKPPPSIGGNGEKQGG